MYVIKSIEDAKALEGKEVGLSGWILIDQEKVNQFAEATGDFQWIHVDTERARRELPGGKTIAHGYLTLSLIPALTGDFVRVENLARALNFGCNKVRFYSMVPVGSRVRGNCPTYIQRAEYGLGVGKQYGKLERGISGIRRRFHLPHVGYGRKLIRHAKGFGEHERDPRVVGCTPANHL